MLLARKPEWGTRARAPKEEVSDTRLYLKKSAWHFTHRMKAKLPQMHILGGSHLSSSVLLCGSVQIVSFHLSDKQTSDILKFGDSSRTNEGLLMLVPAWHSMRNMCMGWGTGGKRSVCLWVWVKGMPWAESLASPGAVREGRASTATGRGPSGHVNIWWASIKGL